MNNTWIKIIIGAVVAGAAVTAAIFYARNAGEPPVSNTNQDTSTIVSVYFDHTGQNPNAINCSAVFPVNRTVTQTNQLADSLDTLFAGPTASEQAAGFSSVFSAATADSLQSVRVENTIAYIDLADIRSIVPNVSASCSSAQFLASIEKTATQFTGVSSVVLAINGDPQTLYDWLQLDCPQNSNQCDPTPFANTTNTNSASTITANIYLVAIDDNGRSGDPIGCGDSLVAVPVSVQPETANQAGSIKAVLAKLLAIKDQQYGESGLYHALYQSRLTIDQVSFANGSATVSLSGTMALGGTCDTPRVSAQILETIKQFPDVTSTTVTVNGQSLEDALSLR